MDPRREAQTVARNVRSQVSATGNTIESVARATGTPIEKFLGITEFNFAEMVAVGGFLHVRVSDFMKGIA